MELYKKFSNLFDVNIIYQLSNKDILVASSNQIKIYSINTFDKIYYFKEIKSSIISIKSITELKLDKNKGIILAMYLSDFSIQIIKLSKIVKSHSSVYRHKLNQTIGIKTNKRIGIETYACINSCLNYLIIGINNKVHYYKNKDVDKINFTQEKEFKINQKLNPNRRKIENIVGISSVKYKNYTLLIIILEEMSISIHYDIKIYFLKNLN